METNCLKKNENQVNTLSMKKAVEKSTEPVLPRQSQSVKISVASPAELTQHF
jgi:hypothetical protein